MQRSHHYQVTVEWTGNRGTGTSGYRDYGRGHDVSAEGKTVTIPGSADRTFRGEPERWNPEELLVSSLAQCHMLAYLHLAAVAGVVVTHYVDTPLGTMVLERDGSGQFSEVLLRPAVTVTDPAMIDKAQELHEDAHSTCFIARSVNFPVRHAPETHVTPDA
ncbi:OsmC family protein [Phytoactinopolyspora alkaliphila]|uniref:OsmC family protein n=1 Tax=Phytoactinopolyspora alkaliphila TaxID=1783498 RepID=A0A6N9YKJ3_9ACTN|nr:OsmC family protein [Phytoactinopolyspora alkaliphila]NED95556.1 OsmC family protein [Phytoactinopolyspora alkaliphila]